VAAVYPPESFGSYGCTPDPDLGLYCPKNHFKGMLLYGMQGWHFMTRNGNRGKEFDPHFQTPFAVS